MLQQYLFPAGAKSGEIIVTVVDREGQNCKDLVSMTEGLGRVTGEESLSDDRNRVEETV